MKHVYLFSGLGADERAFQKLDLGDAAVHHIRWEQPKRDESLEVYARRLSGQITTWHPTLIGLSFGGIVAGEVAKFLEVERLILIASVKSAAELPFYYRWSGALGLHKLLPTRLLMRPTGFAAWLFGIKEPDDKRLLAAILRDTDPVFLRWAIHTIATWRGSATHRQLYHIHGTTDRILPYSIVNPDISVKGGGHLMTVTKAEEVSAVLRKVLANSVGQQNIPSVQK